MRGARSTRWPCPGTPFLLLSSLFLSTSDWEIMMVKLFSNGDIGVVNMPGHPWHQEIVEVTVFDHLSSPERGEQVLCVDRLFDRDECECTPILADIHVTRMEIIDIRDLLPQPRVLLDTLVIGNTAELDAFIDSLAD